MNVKNVNKMLLLLGAVSIISSSVLAKDYDRINGNKSNKNLYNMENVSLAELPKEIYDTIEKNIETKLEKKFTTRYNKSIENMRKRLEKDLLSQYKLIAYTEEARKKVLDEIKIKEKILMEKEKRLEAKQKAYEDKKLAIENNIIQQKVEEATKGALQNFIIKHSKDRKLNEIKAVEKSLNLNKSSNLNNVNAIKTNEETNLKTNIFNTQNIGN